MQNTISGQHVATGEALQEHVQTRMEALDARYNARLVSSQTIFSRGPRDTGFHCAITAHAAGRSKVFTAEADGHVSAQQVFDQAYEKLTKQVRRHVRSRKDVPHTRLEFNEEE